MNTLKAFPRRRAGAWLLPLLALAAVQAGCGGSASAPAQTGKATAAEVPCTQRSDPRVLAMSDEGIGLTTELGLAAGRYALPAAAAPTQLVVMFHGHGNDSCSWRNHLRQAAARGAIAVAMDYTGQRQEPVENYGWFVREGAADSIAAAKHFIARYPSITQVFAFGVSMGGNAAGVAVASGDARRADGSALFDYFVVVEGVNNLIEEYLIIVGVAPVNEGAALAQREIEEENGGSLQEQPEKYRELTNVMRAADMAGLKGAVVVHPVDDGLVSTTQSPEMAAALNAVGVPAHLYTVLLHGDGETGTTFTSNVNPLFEGAGQQYPDPFAGHGWEGSDTHIVIKQGFDELFRLMDGGTVTPGETVIPGN